MTKILIIDDVDVKPLMAPRLAEHGFDVAQILDTADAVAEVEKLRPDLVLLDLHFPDDEFLSARTSGGELHTSLRQRFPQLPIFIFSSRPVDNAIPRENFEIEPHAIIRKPDFADKDWPASYAKRLRRLLERVAPNSPVDWLEGFGFCVGESEGMLAFARDAKLAAASQLNILLVGEEGTGKELAARAIHAASGNQGRFGSVRLAPTTAEQIGPDWMAEAQGGTLFLDGLADLAQDAQVALLAWIDDIQGPGGLMPRTRLIASCVHDLDADVEQGRFNRRLHDRLAQTALSLTPLRDRLGDISALFARCVDHFNQTAELPISPQFRPETEALLRSHRWPGNIREFNKVVDHAIAFTGNEILMPEDIVITRATPSALKDTTAATLGRLLPTSDSTPSGMPLDQGRMADYYFETMDKLGPVYRYNYFKQLPADMQLPVARRVLAFLRKPGKPLTQQDFVEYFYGTESAELRRFNAVRRYFTDKHIWAGLGSL